MTKCINLAPGFRCEPCPSGFDGIHVNGYYAESITQDYNKQVCNDVDECALGMSNCGYNSICINSIGSFTCHCNKGFILNITSGCNAIPGMCPDGTVCDKNAVCRHLGASEVFCFTRFLSIHFSNWHWLLQFRCVCKIGFGGDGHFCAPDSDLDGWPDHALNCTDIRCKSDNCLYVPNSGQEDSDGDMIGDACDPGLWKKKTNFLRENIWNQFHIICNKNLDADNDGVLNEVDNCVFIANDQTDSDHDGGISISISI